MGSKDWLANRMNESAAAFPWNPILQAGISSFFSELRPLLSATCLWSEAAFLCASSDCQVSPVATRLHMWGCSDGAMMIFRRNASGSCSGTLLLSPERLEHPCNSFFAFADWSPDLVIPLPLALICTAVMLPVRWTSGPLNFAPAQMHTRCFSNADASDISSVHFLPCLHFKPIHNAGQTRQNSCAGLVRLGERVLLSLIFPSFFKRPKRK